MLAVCGGEEEKGRKPIILYNMEELAEITEERMCYATLVYQIFDYLMENIPTESSPTLMTCGRWDRKDAEKILHIRNAVAILMEDASGKTKDRVREELEGKYTWEE
jgi:hypothetical protein